MKNFIVVGHVAKTTPDFSLEDIPGTSGRIDILCRCVTAAFVLSHGIRRDVGVYLVLLGAEPSKIIYLQGTELKHLNPDERTTAALIKKALAVEATQEWSKSTPGIFVRTGGFAELVESGVELIYLRENGSDLRGVALPDEPVFVLGDHQGMTEDEEALLEKAGARVVSVGPVSLHADHCIVLINNELDIRAANTNVSELKDN
jgi:tRNA (pseudouridine54-N1)-methyltransferase